MLPLWRKRVQLLLSPQGADIIIRSPFGRIRYQQSLTFSLGIERNSTRSLDSIYHELTDWFASNPTWHQGDLDIVLSHHWVHLLLQPSVAGLSSKETHAMALSAFVEQFGLEATDWQVRVDHVKPGQMALCAALQGLHLNLIQAFAAQFGFKLRSIQPSMVAVVNQHKAKFSNNSVVIAMLAGHYWQTLWMQAGQCRYVQTLTYEAGQEAISLESFVNRLAWQTSQTIDLVYCLSEHVTTSVDFSDQRFQHIQIQNRFAQPSKGNQQDSQRMSQTDQGMPLVSWLECLQ